MKKLTSTIDTSKIQSIIDAFNNSKLSADAFSASLGGVDDALLSYLRTCKNGEAYAVGFEKHISKTNQSIGLMGVRSKIAAVGVGILNSVLSASISALAGFAISGVVKLFDYVHKSQKEIAESAEEAKNNIEELYSTLNSSKNFAKSSGNRFAELSQGVDQTTGKNKSLSDAEYEEFLDLSNQIADLFPTLERVYTSNGDAIVKLTGNVDNIVKSIDELIVKQTELTNLNITEDIPDIYDGIKSRVKEIRKEIKDIQKEIKEIQEDEKEELASFYTNYKIPLTETGENIQTTFKTSNTFDIGKLKGELDSRGIEYTTKDLLLQEKTLGNNFKTDTYTVFDFKMSDEEYDQILQEAKTQVEQLHLDYSEEINKLNKKLAIKQEEIGAEYNSIKQSMTSWLSTEYTYNTMSADMQNVMQQLIDDLDWENLDFKNWEDAEKYIRDNYLYIFTSGINTDSLTSLFDESTQNLPVDEYINRVKETVAEIQEELKKIGVDFDFNLDFLIADKQDLQSRVYNKLGQTYGKNNPITEYINSLNASDLSIVLNLEIDSSTPLDDIKRMVEEAKKLGSKTGEIIDLSPINEQLDKIQSAYKTVASAIDEYDAKQSLSLDTVQSLLELGDEYLSVLYDEEGQLQLNTDTYNALTKAKLREMMTSIMLNALTTVETLKDEKTAADYLKESTVALADAKWYEIETTIESERVALLEAKAQGEVVDARLEALDRLEESTKNKRKLIQEAYDSIDQDANNFYGHTGNTDDDDDTDETINQIDWAANSIENLQNKIEKLNIAIENAPNYTEQLGLTEKLIKKQKKLKSLLKDVRDESSERYTDSLGEFSSSELAKYQPLIESTKPVTLEMFEGKDQQELYEKVKAAQEAWQAYQQAILDYREQVGVVADSQKQKYELEQEELQTGIDIQQNEKNDIQNKIDKQEAKKGYADEELYLSLRKQNNVILDETNKKLEKAKEHRREVAKEEGKNSKAYLEADNEVQELQNNVSELRQEQVELNRTILQYPIHKYEEAKEKLEEQLEVYKEYQEQLESAISGASNILQDEIDTYSDLKESISDSYDAQIKSINDKKDALTETNDALKEQMALEQAQYNLDRAMNQKTVKVIRNKQVVYEADARAIIDAQKQLDEEKYNIAVSSFDKQIKSLEEQKQNAIDGIDNQIKLLQDYKDKVDGIVGSYEKALELQAFLSVFNSDGKGMEKLLNMDESLYNEMFNQYTDASSDVTETEEEISTIDKAIEEIEKIASRWDGAKTTIKKARQEIEDVLTNTEKEFQAIKDRNEAAKTVNKQWKKVKEKTIESLGLIEQNQISSKDAEKKILDERLGNIKTFAEEANGYLSSIGNSIPNITIDLPEVPDDSSDEDSSDKEGDSKKGNGKKSNKDKEEEKDKKGKKNHSGMENGFIGSKLSNQDDTFQYVTLTKLKPDEVPSVLQVGEAVLTKLQQTNVLDNLRTAFYTGIKLPNFNNIQKANTTTFTAPSISFNGDIIVQGVNNTTEFAQKIKSEFLTKLSQELYK